MDCPKISVIIPTYNRADLLPGAVESVLNQTFADFELLIVDDGSTDNTKAVVGGLIKRDSRIKYLRQNHSGAPARPTNAGIRKAGGKYVAFLDDDDEWLPGKLKSQAALFSRFGKLGLVGCALEIVFEGGDFIRVGYSEQPKNYLTDLLRQNFLYSASSVMADKIVFFRAGMFDEALKNGQDWDMWIRIAEAGYDFAFVPEVQFKYYVHQKSISNMSSQSEIENDLDRIFNKYRSYYRADKKLHSIKLGYDGIRYFRMNEFKKARKKFLHSIVVYPLNIKSHIYFAIALCGPRPYKTLSGLKRLLSTAVRRILPGRAARRRIQGCSRR